ncbi:iron ABC transporter permease [Rhodobacterales bacterium]|nr:iron ABC transporter permease [Rhodobacterales bacterium]
MSGAVSVQTGSGSRRSGLARPLVLTLLALAGAGALSMLIGARPITFAEIWQAFTAFDPASAENIVIREIRLPKTLAGMLVGAALGTAGAIMQSVTRNPLADPGLLGVNAGAAAGVVLPIWLLGMSDPSAFVWPALGGAFTASLLVWALGSTGAGIAGLLIAGAAITAFLLSLVGGLMLLSQTTLDVYRHWVLGSLDGIAMSDVTSLLPFFGVGFLAAALAARHLNALALGSDLARTLGTRIWATRALSLAAIACLCAASVALAGPVGFIGLLVPHAARLFSAGDMRAATVLSAFFGAILLLIADIAGRILLPGIQVEAGLTIAIVGGPLMVALICRGRMVAL